MAYWCCVFCAFSAVFLHLLLTHINTSHNLLRIVELIKARQDFEELIH